MLACKTTYLGWSCRVRKSGPGTVNGFGSSFNKAKIVAGMAGENLHFHDLRSNSTKGEA